MDTEDFEMMHRLLAVTEAFYRRHSDTIKESHGIQHAIQVQTHAASALKCVKVDCNHLEIHAAALLHDVDDSKYFDHDDYRNARGILQETGIEDMENILSMIQLVSCSQNGNSVPQSIVDSQSYHFLIPRWADRLEAVGARGVVRCYQYNVEHGLPLFSEASPRATTEDEVWELATPQRFADYQALGGSSADMISHYYDKLLHVARAPPEYVQNAYLQKRARESSRELVEVCIRFGKTGRVDTDYIQQVAFRLGMTVDEGVYR